MNKTAFIFPGQGIEFVGIGSNFILNDLVKTVASRIKKEVELYSIFDTRSFNEFVKSIL